MSIKMFSKILVANRGEIAVRVIRACREMGIASVAVYSEADRDALHVRVADEAVPVGPAAAGESYLNVPNLLEAARQTGAEAVHPGYGFLSENAAFAEAVSAAGLVFIGPAAQAIRQMGDKAGARTRMQAAGVPVVPGFQDLDDDASLRRAAAGLGFPLLVKAAAGGGGKGMRVVREAGELDEALSAARRESQRAFSDSRLILERYVEHAHHVEFQVLGDQHGSLLHLFERECSVQRRHQKIIEESPSPIMDSELRGQMAAAALTAARAVDYTNAGTIEFIVDPHTRQFYFLEMNTRLQVEHPVTEMVTGLDLVQWQIRIAAGERLPLTQEQITQRGHALECRLYAEDPANNFLPATGKLLLFKEPWGPGIRTDSGLASGDEITIHYDPLLAKLIVYAEDREAAIQRMKTALCDTVLLGVTTNLRFLTDVLAHPDFEQGRAYTTWIEKTFDDWEAIHCQVPVAVLAAAALTQFEDPPDEVHLSGGHGSNPYSPWQTGSAFRLGQGG